MEKKLILLDYLADIINFAHLSVYLEIKEKRIHTNQKRWNENHWTQSSQGRLFCRKQMLVQVANQRNHGEPIFPSVGKIERSCFDEIEKIFNYHIERQPNINWYFPDGRILHLRLLLEFDECQHFLKGRLREKDIEREEYLVSQGYIMSRIKQEDWLNNKEKVIQDLKIIITELSK